MMLRLFIARAGSKPAFLSPARAGKKMRPGPVLHEIATRPLFGLDVEDRELELALAAAGVAKDNWVYWLPAQLKVSAKP
jgi:hypothetical protein